MISRETTIFLKTRSNKFWSGFSFVSLWLKGRHHNDALAAEACATPLQFVRVVYYHNVILYKVEISEA